MIAEWDWKTARTVSLKRQHRQPNANHPASRAFSKCMVIQRTRMPAWRLLMYETLHVALDDEETGCGLTMQPFLRVTPAFAEEF